MDFSIICILLVVIYIQEEGVGVGVGLFCFLSINYLNEKQGKPWLLFPYLFELDIWFSFTNNWLSSQISSSLHCGGKLLLYARRSLALAGAGLQLALTLCLACVAHDYGSCWQLSSPWDCGRKGILN